MEAKLIAHPRYFIINGVSLRPLSLEPLTDEQAEQAVRHFYAQNRRKLRKGQICDFPFHATGEMLSLFEKRK